MEYSLAEIAKYLGAELSGDGNCMINGIAPVENAQSGEITFLEKAGFRKHLANTKADAVILSPDEQQNYSGNKIIVANPYLSYAKLTGLFSDIPAPPPGIHPRAVIADNCNIHDSVRIAANCTIGNNVNIGANTIIEPGCVIGDGVRIGENCRLYSNVTVYYRVSIGDQVIIHSGTVVGADGFGNANDRGVWKKIYQLGSVVIGNDVEIGANTCIDRGAIEDTIIEDGVKIDNLDQIAHNVRVGAHTAIAGCCAIAGSVTIGRHCMIGGNVSLNGHIDIADQVIISGASAVGRSIKEPGIYSSGVEAQPHFKWYRILSNLFRIKELTDKVHKLEGKQSD